MWWLKIPLNADTGCLSDTPPDNRRNTTVKVKHWQTFHAKPKLCSVQKGLSHTHTIL